MEPFIEKCQTVRSTLLLPLLVDHSVQFSLLEREREGPIAKMVI